MLRELVWRWGLVLFAEGWHETVEVVPGFSVCQACLLPEHGALPYLSPGTAPLERSETLPNHSEQRERPVSR
ncbi:MAG: hypothetical protein AAGI08_05660 [Bacteroidota bacterium]